MVGPDQNEKTPQACLGDVVGSLLLPNIDTVAHRLESLSDRFKPVFALEEGPDTLQNQKGGAEHPSQLREVDNHLAARVGEPKPMSGPTEGLAGESRRDHLHPSEFSPFRAVLQPNAAGRMAPSTPVGCVVGRYGLALGVACPDGSTSQPTRSDGETAQAARQVRVRPWLPLPMAIPSVPSILGAAQVYLDNGRV